MRELLIAAGIVALLVYAAVSGVPAFGQDVPTNECGCEMPYARGGGMYRHVMCLLEGTEVTASDALQVLRWSVGDHREFE